MKRLSMILIVLMTLFLIGCANKPTEYMFSDEISPIAIQAFDDGVEFSEQTEDFREIVGTYYTIGGSKTIILVHMMKQDRSSWDGLVPILLNKGYDVVAIDLRGHGESEGDLSEFVRQEFADMFLDIGAAKKFLDDKGFSGDIILIGASMGANSALRYAAEDKAVTHVVLLSPGLDYRGATTEDVLREYHRKLLVVVGDDDVYARQSGTKLFSQAAIVEENKKYIQYDGGEHGTELFAENPLAEDIIEWLRLTT